MERGRCVVAAKTYMFCWPGGTGLRLGFIHCLHLQKSRTLSIYHSSGRGLGGVPPPRLWSMNNLVSLASLRITATSPAPISVNSCQGRTASLTGISMVQDPGGTPAVQCRIPSAWSELNCLMPKIVLYPLGAIVQRLARPRALAGSTNLAS